MKLFYRLFAVLTISLMFFAVGCDSDDDGSIDPGVNPVIGTWELTNISGTYQGVPVSGPPALIGLEMTVDLQGDATYQVEIRYQDDQTLEDGTWQSTETIITLTSSTGLAADWPYTMDGNNSLTASIDTDEFDLGVPGVTGTWQGTFTRQ